MIFVTPASNNLLTNVCLRLARDLAVTSWSPCWCAVLSNFGIDSVYLSLLVATMTEVYWPRPYVMWPSHVVMKPLSDANIHAWTQNIIFISMPWTLISMSRLPTSSATVTMLAKFLRWPRVTSSKSPTTRVSGMLLHCHIKDCYDTECQYMDCNYIYCHRKYCCHTECPQKDCMTLS